MTSLVAEAFDWGRPADHTGGIVQVSTVFGDDPNIGTRHSRLRSTPHGLRFRDYRFCPASGRTFASPRSRTDRSLSLPRETFRSRIACPCFALVWPGLLLPFLTYAGRCRICPGITCVIACRVGWHDRGAMTSDTKIFVGLRPTRGKPVQHRETSGPRCQWDDCDGHGTHRAPVGADGEGLYLLFCFFACR
jgi:hypothetical protein